MLSNRFYRFRDLALAGLALIASCAPGLAENGRSAFVRVSQIGYEAGHAPFRAYLMTTAPQNGTRFRVLDAKGSTAFQADVGPHLGSWSNSERLIYQVFALDFDVPGCDTYTISVSGPQSARSPAFPVDSPGRLYSGLLLNTKFFYETERDGPNYRPNALRSAPGHLNDSHATVYLTPPLDDNDLIATTGKPLAANGAVIDAAGGWWDAGDYMKYVETISYTVALQEIGIRDFPGQMGSEAPE